jgi:hypothetical protein
MFLHKLLAQYSDDYYDYAYAKSGARPNRATNTGHDT